MSMKSILSLMTVSLFSAWLLAACGGGSSGGGGGIRASENLVVKLNRNGTASIFQTVPGQENRMLAAVTDFLIRKAEAAALSGHVVTIYGDLDPATGNTPDTASGEVDSGITDGSGEAKFFLSPGSYELCFDGDTLNCEQVDVVGEDSIVTVTFTCDDSGTETVCTKESTNVDTISSLQGTQTTLCHIPKGNPAAQKTITVGTSAVPAHIGKHGGDYLGPCNDLEPVIGITTAGGDDPNSGGNKNPNKGPGNNSNPNNPNNQL